MFGGVEWSPETHVTRLYCSLQHELLFPLLTHLSLVMMLFICVCLSQPIERSPTWMKKIIRGHAFRGLFLAADFPFPPANIKWLTVVSVYHNIHPHTTFLNLGGEVRTFKMKALCFTVMDYAAWEMFKSGKLVYHTTQELMEANDFFWKKDSKLWFSQIIVMR